MFGLLCKVMVGVVVNVTVTLSGRIIVLVQISWCGVIGIASLISGYTIWYNITRESLSCAEKLLNRSA